MPVGFTKKERHGKGKMHKGNWKAEQFPLPALIERPSEVNDLIVLY